MDDNERGELRRVTRVLDAIDHGGLLAAPPADAGERVRHEAGVALVEVAHERLTGMLATLPE